MLRRGYKERQLRSEAESRGRVIRYFLSEWATMSNQSLRQLRNRIRSERSRLGEALWTQGAELFSEDPELCSIDWLYWNDWTLKQLDDLIVEIEGIAELLREADEIANGDDADDPYSDIGWVRDFLRGGGAD